jgi:hypothetical protein
LKVIYSLSENTNNIFQITLDIFCGNACSNHKKNMQVHWKGCCQCSHYICHRISISTVADSGDSEVVAFTESRDGMTIPRCRGCVCEVSRDWVQFLSQITCRGRPFG